MTRTSVQGATPVVVPEGDNLTSTIWQRAERSGGKPALHHHDGSGWRAITWSELADRVRGVAAGLLAMGLEKGDRIALMAPTQVEWTVADLAILAAGGVTVPIYETSSSDQCAWYLADSGARFAIAATPDHAKTLDGARGEAKDLGEIFVIADGGLEAIAERAREAGAEDPTAAVAARVAEVGTADLASLVYTSGTTGRPKGCMLTHGNLLSTARQTELTLGEVLQEGSSTLLFLPLAHVFARIIQFGCLEASCQIAYNRSVDVLVDDLGTFRPTFLLSVPRVFDKVYNAAQRSAEGWKSSVFDFASATAREYSEASSPSPLTRVKHLVADKLVYSKLRERLGGRIDYCVSGGAPLAPHLASFFHAAGVTILEGYGLTETSAASTVNTPMANRFGTVGKPNPGTEIRIAENGEILIRGGGVFQGYWHNDEASSEVLDADGWFRTGDLGGIDDDGYVKITGRSKELIVTASGKNVAPAVLEERLKAHRLVSQAMVVGDDRPFIAALITLEPDELAAFAGQQGLSGSMAEMGASDAVQTELQKAVDHANAAVSKAESIRTFAVLGRDFSEEENEMTPTLKLKRKQVSEHFADEIEGLYRR